MIKKLLAALFAILLPLQSKADFPYETYSGSFSGTAHLQYRDFSWGWVDYNDAMISVSFNVGGISNVVFRMGDSSGKYWLTAYNGIVSQSATSTSYAILIPRTNIPPPRSYLAEFLGSYMTTNGTNAVYSPTRVLARGRIETAWSVYSATNSASWTPINVFAVFPTNVALAEVDPVWLAEKSGYATTVQLAQVYTKAESDSKFATTGSLATLSQQYAATSSRVDTVYNYGNHGTNQYVTSSQATTIVNTLAYPLASGQVVSQRLVAVENEYMPRTNSAGLKLVSMAGTGITVVAENRGATAHGTNWWGMLEVTGGGASFAGSVGAQGIILRGDGAWFRGVGYASKTVLPGTTTVSGVGAFAVGQFLGTNAISGMGSGLIGNFFGNADISGPGSLAIGVGGTVSNDGYGVLQLVGANSETPSASSKAAASLGLGSSIITSKHSIVGHNHRSHGSNSVTMSSYWIGDINIVDYLSDSANHTGALTAYVLGSAWTNLQSYGAWTNVPSPNLTGYATTGQLAVVSAVGSSNTASILQLGIDIAGLSPSNWANYIATAPINADYGISNANYINFSLDSSNHIPPNSFGIRGPNKPVHITNTGSTNTILTEGTFSPLLYPTIAAANTNYFRYTTTQPTNFSYSGAPWQFTWMNIPGVTTQRTLVAYDGTGWYYQVMNRMP